MLVGCWLQEAFDQAVACLRVASTALGKAYPAVTGHSQLSSELQQLHEALSAPLAELEARVRTHAQPSRVLAWAVPSAFQQHQQA